MKKSIITTVILGVSFSSMVVFAESSGALEKEYAKGKNEERIREMVMGGSGLLRGKELNDDIKIPGAPEISSVSSSDEPQQNLRNISLSRVKARAVQAIRERVNALNANKNVITNSPSLTAEQKNSLTTALNAPVAGLTTLGASIASSTDATTTKALFGTIFTNFRIYGIVLPQVRLEKRIYDLQNHSTKLSATFLKVQTKIDEYKGKGKDVTVWQKSLDDAKILVANDMNTLANLLPKVKALTPTEYGTTSKMVIENANKDLRMVAKDFNGIAKNLRKPSILKNISVTGTSTIATTTIR